MGEIGISRALSTAFDPCLRRLGLPRQLKRSCPDPICYMNTLFQLVCI